MFAGRNQTASARHRKTDDARQTSLFAGRNQTTLAGQRKTENIRQYKQESNYYCLQCKS